MAVEKLTFEMNAVGNAVPVMQKTQAQLKSLDNQFKKSSTAMQSYSRATMAMDTKTRKFAKGALQQAGYQIGDYAVQVANGTSAIQAFGQQGSQMLGIFGPTGAILGAVVAIFSAIGVAASKSGQELQNVGSVLGVLQEPLVQVKDALMEVKQAFGSVMPFIAQNIDTALIAAGLFGGYMAVRYVASLALATTSTLTFRSAIVSVGVAVNAVNKVLMRFLPFALLIGLAKLIEMFIQLKNGAGGLGETFKLLQNLWQAVTLEMAMLGESLQKALVASGWSIAAGFAQAFGKVSSLYDSLVDYMVNGPLNALFEFAGLDYRLEKNINPITAKLQELEDEYTNNAATALQASVTAISGMTMTKEALEALRQAYRDGAVDIVLFGDATEEAAEKSKSKLDEIKDRAKTVGQMVGSSMENAMMDAVKGTKSLADAFRSMASEIIADLYRIFVVKKITNFIAGAIEGYMSPSSVPAAPMPRPAIPSADGGGYTGNSARSGGLDGKGGFMAMLHPRETVLDHTKGQGTGGVVINQTINVSTGVQQTVRSEIKSLMPQIAESAKAAVVDAKRRGGSYGRSFA